MTEMKNGEDLPPTSRKAQSLFELTQTMFAFFFSYFASAQDTLLRDFNQYRNALYKSLVRGSTKGRSLLKKAILFNGVLFSLSFIVLVLLIGCLLSAMGTTIAFRYYMLRHVAGSHVIPLDFNTMPFYTEWWRNQPIDDAAFTHLSLLAQERPPVGSRLEGNQSGRMTPYSSEGVELAYADMKLSILNRYRNSVLATSTMVLSSGLTEKVFLHGGDVNLEAIFQLGSPIFNAKAEYFGKMQFVFLREDVGRDVTLMVENTMLLAEDADLPQPLATLDVVFRKYVSLNVRTGDPLLWWPIRIAKYIFQILFYIPLKGFQIIQRLYIDSNTAPFPKIDHDREVAVTVNLYNRFAPPLSLQSRLRAMNVTVYQNHDGDSSVSLKRAKLLRMTFYSFLDLHGVVGWLVHHPVISFVFLTMFTFAVFSSVTFIVCTVLVVMLYRKVKSRTPETGHAIDLNPSMTRSLKQPIERSHHSKLRARTSENRSLSTAPPEMDEFRRFVWSYYSSNSSDSAEEEPAGGPISKHRKDR
ncbi:unnamed protein product [Phytomonas sp. Hart1]|nr:unnamed protein product [Phytomonas sp. Hart1]|eukprot:CCW71635.1 unnamed protein product [Phytomonas sp. isolate Hart1]